MGKLSRRGLISALGGAAASAVSAKTSVAASFSNARETTQKEWFDDVFQSKAAQGTLNLYRFSDEIYAITKPIAWTPNPGSSKELKRVEVPTGFVTDFASVPRIFWSILPRDGIYVYPAIVHDYMYWTQEAQRENADETLREGMQDFAVDNVSGNAIYWSVRAAGWLAWASNAKLRESGEKRILTSFPDSPMVSWFDWKRDPTHFQ